MNKHKFNATSIVVYKGIIAQYSTILPFLEDEEDFDEVKLASDEDLKKYYSCK